jgi:hypothetical protein
MSRRSALAGFVFATACGSTVAGRIPSTGASANGLGPVFSPSGPNAQYYGEEEGFPIADRSLTIQPGEPHNAKYRIGAYSHFDEIYPTHRIERAANPWRFNRTERISGIPSRAIVLPLQSNYCAILWPVC